MFRCHGYYLVFAVMVWISGCATLPDADFDLVETEYRMVRNCERLGAVAEMADPGKIISIMDRNEMIHRIKAQAVELGATHLVWDYKTNDAASATAFRCRN